MNNDRKNGGNAQDGGGLKRILICADDFGMSSAIDAGIIELARAGCLSAVSCLSVGKSFAADAPSLAELPIDKGLHLDLTEPLAGKTFAQPLPRLIWNCFSRRVDPTLVRREIERQLAAFERVLGCPPDYVDGHQHVHQFPVVRECLIDILRRRFGTHLPWLRSTLPPAGLPAGVRIKAGLIGLLGGRSMQAMAGQSGFRMNRRLLGVYGFQGGEAEYLRLLDEWLGLAETDDLIMCHPGKGMTAGDSLGMQRGAEFAALSGAALPILLERHRAYIGQGMGRKRR
jgi:predicted glycoside hydrolase/deacetylase ChbG (UPF0249 family)